LRFHERIGLAARRRLELGALLRACRTLQHVLYRVGGVLD
jgi:hypothetical protein